MLSPTATSIHSFELNTSTLAIGETQLRAADVGLRFGGLQALDGVDLNVRQGDIHAVIGPNGAGKTSLLNCISGFYRPRAGSLEFRNRGRAHDLVHLSVPNIARLGVARSFQNLELFKHMTVLDNLMLGRHSHMRHELLSSLVWLGPARRQEARQRALVEEVIDFLRLQPARHRQVGSLAYGLQKRVELGRALCMQPALLLLDEPLAGMNAEEKDWMVRHILDLNEVARLTVLIIEHDMSVIMDISHRITVLNFGRVIADGNAAGVSAAPAVIDAYLGVVDS